MNVRRLVLLLCCASVALPAASASAQNPVNAGYPRVPIDVPPVRTHEPSTSVEASRNDGPGNRTVSARPGRLAFTGIDVRFLLLGGVGLLGAGYGLRRRARHQE